MKQQTRGNRAHTYHTPDRQVGTCQKDKAGNAKGVEHSGGTLLQDGQDVGNGEKSSSSLDGSHNDADDEEDENCDVEAIVEEEGGDLEAVDVVVPLQNHVFLEVCLAVSQASVDLDKVYIGLVAVGLCAVAEGSVLALYIKKDTLFLVFDLLDFILSLAFCYTQTFDLLLAVRLDGSNLLFVLLFVAGNVGILHFFYSECNLLACHIGVGDSFLAQCIDLTTVCRRILFGFYDCLLCVFNNLLLGFGREKLALLC